MSRARGEDEAAGIEAETKADLVVAREDLDVVHHTTEEEGAFPRTDLGEEVLHMTGEEALHGTQEIEVTRASNGKNGPSRGRSVVASHR